MDSHRIRSLTSRRPPSAQISTHNVRSTVVIVIGVLTLFTGIILIVAFGVPSDVTRNPSSLSGTLVCAAGGLIIAVGSLYAYRTHRRNNRPRLRQVTRVRTLCRHVAPALDDHAFSRKLSTQAEVTASQSNSVGMVDELAGAVRWSPHAATDSYS